MQADPRRRTAAHGAFVNLRSPAGPAAARRIAWRLPLLALALAGALGGCATPGTGTRGDGRQLVVIGSANRSGSGAAYVGNVLTQDELRNCISMDRRYCALHSTITHGGDEQLLDEERLRIEREGDALDAAGVRVNRYSQADVDAYNERIRAHTSRINEYNARVAQRSGQVNALNQVADQFNAACVGKAFYEDDLQAVSPGWTQCPGATQAPR